MFLEGKKKKNEEEDVSIHIRGVFKKNEKFTHFFSQNLITSVSILNV